MTSDRHIKRNCWMLGVATGFAATMSFAATPPQELTPQTEVNTLIASNKRTSEAPSAVAAPNYRSSEMGVRRAAEQGYEPLRRYVQRTRMIYNYYFWNFAKQE